MVPSGFTMNPFKFSMPLNLNTLKETDFHKICSFNRDKKKAEW